MRLRSEAEAPWRWELLINLWCCLLASLVLVIIDLPALTDRVIRFTLYGTACISAALAFGFACTQLAAGLAHAPNSLPVQQSLEVWRSYLQHRAVIQSFRGILPRGS